LAEHLVADQTLEQLSVVELAVLIMSSYLHDLGMCLTASERKRLLLSPEFSDHLRGWPQLEQEIRTTRAKLRQAGAGEALVLETRLFQLQEAALASFLRRRHAAPDRYAQLTQVLKETAGRADLFQTAGVSFEAELIDICGSHNLDAAVLLQARSAYDDRFPRDLAIGGFRLNTQFCAAVLRLADILDFDRERTPRVLFESIGVADSTLPNASVSLREWNKHMAVHAITIGENEIVVSADSTHPAIERSVRDFCAIIEREVRDTASVLKRNAPPIVEVYRVDLPISVRAQIRSIGYTYRDLAFRLDESSISRLLMGDALYSNKTVALRELIQNAIDACRVKQLLSQGQSYKPSILVTFEQDGYDRVWLVVQDNGIGMDEFVLSNYFFRVGESYYQSDEFERLSRGSGFAPISRFGIGILSVFMIGDVLEVATRNPQSPRGDTVFRNVRVDGRFGLAFVTERAEGPPGTRVRVRLSQPSVLAATLFLAEGANYVRDVVRRPAVPVEVQLPYFSGTLRPSAFVSLKEDAATRLRAKGLEPVVLDVGRWSARVSGRAILFFYLRADGQLMHRDELTGAMLKAQELGEFLTNYQGNKITVNGISMSLKKLGSVLGSKGDRIPGAIDVELLGDEDVKYDVARRKLIGQGVMIVRQELRSAIVQGLKDMGIYARLHAETLKAIADATQKLNVTPKGSTRPVDPHVLSVVRDALPDYKWPVGLHHMLAEQLGISPGLVYRAIGALLETGSVRKPGSSSEEQGAV
jgi:signal transduction histidine kinase